MPSLENLIDILEHARLRNAIKGAIWVKAQATLADAQAPASRKEWAAEAFRNTGLWMELILKYILGLHYELILYPIIPIVEETV